MPTDGFDDAIDDLDELQENAQALEGETEVPLDELFKDGFVRAHTDFDSLEAFFEASPWTVESDGDLEAIPDDEFDEYVDQHTRFGSFEAMQKKALEKWTADQLGL